MKDRRDVILEIAELERWLSSIINGDPAEDNNWALTLIVKAKIEALKWVLDEV